MWGAILGGVLGLIGQHKAGNSADDAAARSAAQEAKARKAERKAVKKVLKAVKKEGKQQRADLQDALAAEKRANAEAMALHATEKAELAQLAASERQQAIDDEASQFVRLRAAAEAGGFNPLSVLKAGYLGTSLPSGFLSEGASLSMHELNLNRAIQRGATRSALVSQKANTRSSGITEAMATGHNAYTTRIDAGRASEEARSAAYNDTLNGWSNLGSMIQAGAGIASDWKRLGLDQDALAIDRERLALDASAMDLDRQRAQSEIAFNNWQMSQPAFGSVSNWGRAGPSLSSGSQAAGFDALGRPIDANGNLVSRDMAGPLGVHWDVDETRSPAQYWSDEYGEPGEWIGGAVHMGEDALRNGTFHRIDQMAWDYIRQDVNDAVTRLGRAFGFDGAIRNTNGPAPARMGQTANTSWDGFLDEEEE
nr:MAG: hypothetical protein [Microvirus sp.]